MFHSITPSSLLLFCYTVKRKVLDYLKFLKTNLCTDVQKNRIQFVVVKLSLRDAKKQKRKQLEQRLS